MVSLEEFNPTQHNIVFLQKLSIDLYSHEVQAYFSFPFWSVSFRKSMIYMIAPSDFFYFFYFLVPSLRGPGPQPFGFEDT